MESLNRRASRKIELAPDEEVAKHSIERLVDEISEPTDIADVSCKREKVNQEALEKAGEILKQLEDEDIDRLSPELQQMHLKTAIEDMEREIKIKYTGKWANLKDFWSVAFRRDKEEALSDLQYAKDSIQVLSVMNRAQAVLPEGVEAPEVTAIEKIKKEVDILVKLREELEERIDGKVKSFFRTKRESSLDWFWKNSAHRTLLEKQLLATSSDGKNLLSMEDYFVFLDIELEVVQERIATLHRQMEGHISGKLIDQDFSKMSQDEVAGIIITEKDLDRERVIDYDSRVTGKNIASMTARELELERKLFEESKERFYEKKVLEFIKNNKERVLELADTSIFLEVQTHLAEIDESDPKFEFDNKSRQGLNETLKMRVIFSALTSLGVRNPVTTHVGDSEGKIISVLAGVLELKIDDENFQNKVSKITERCLGPKWENGEVLKLRNTPDSDSVKIFSGGVMQRVQFDINHNPRRLQYIMNDGITKVIDGVFDKDSWWPHPLGVIIMDSYGNLLLNGKDLISDREFWRSRIDVESIPAGILWHDLSDNGVFLNGKKVGELPMSGRGQPPQHFSGLSKNGVVMQRQLGGVGDEHKKDAGIYINGEQVLNDYGFAFNVKAVVSKDFVFACYKKVDMHSDSAKILLDGKYPIKIISDSPIVEWWVHPRGIVVLNKDKEFRFYSFEKVAQEVRLKNKFNDVLSEKGFKVIPNMEDINANRYGEKLCWFNENNYDKIRAAVISAIYNKDAEALDNYLREEKQKYISIVQNALAEYHDH
ncbi:MAG: hypothetical protein HY225_02095 [Candidatus Vogelbacteria bacterium]|nr:hypothetical protein [Candidatus Vogelbacteria bacterium]